MSDTKPQLSEEMERIVKKTIPFDLDDLADYLPEIRCEKCFSESIDSDEFREWCADCGSSDLLRYKASVICGIETFLATALEEQRAEYLRRLEILDRHSDIRSAVLETSEDGYCYGISDAKNILNGKEAE